MWVWWRHGPHTKYGKSFPLVFWTEQQYDVWFLSTWYTVNGSGLVPSSPHIRSNRNGNMDAGTKKHPCLAQIQPRAGWMGFEEIWVCRNTEWPAKSRTVERFYHNNSLDFGGTIPKLKTYPACGGSCWASTRLCLQDFPRLCLQHFPRLCILICFLSYLP